MRSASHAGAAVTWWEELTPEQRRELIRAIVRQSHRELARELKRARQKLRELHDLELDDDDEEE